MHKHLNINFRVRLIHDGYDIDQFWNGIGENVLFNQKKKLRLNGDSY